MSSVPQATHDNDHVIVVHRWQDRYAHYDEYLDHAARPVTYIATPVGVDSIPMNAARIVTVPRTNDLNALRAITHRLVAEFGPPAAVLALKENDLPVVTQLRAEFGAAGRRPDEMRRFLYKDAMVDAVTALGLPTPRTAAAPDATAVLEFAQGSGFPVVVKPVRGSASEAVHILHSESEVDGSLFAPDRPMLVQEFLPYPIVHVDGVWLGDHHGPWRLSEYMTTCLSFRHGTPFGTVESDDPRLITAMDAYLRTLMPGLCAQPWVYHLEAFVIDDGDGPPRFVFLEVGSRVGGGDIPFIWREVHGVDLMAIEVELQLGRTPAPGPIADEAELGGFLLMPAPAARPCRVVRSTSLVGPGGPYAEKVLPAGGVIPDADAYFEHIGGRFRFRGRSSDQVRAAIRAAAERFEIEAVPLVGSPA